MPGRQSILPLLVRLWWLQKRRTLRPRDFVVGGYLLLLYITFCAGAYIELSSAGAQMPDGSLPLSVGLMVAVATTVPDLITKICFKRGTVVMDDYLRSRPVPRTSWLRFLLVADALNIWTFAIPLMLLLPLVALTGAGRGLAAFALMLLLSLADNLLCTCWRRTADRYMRLGLIIGWIVTEGLLVAIMLVGALWPAGLQGVALAGAVAVTLATIGCLVWFLSSTRSYDEARHRSARHVSTGHVSLFTMQLLGLIRTKRLRNQMLLFTFIFMANSYFVALTDTAASALDGVIAIFMPSVFLSQWTLGVEANFFQGLMTKPVSVTRLLDNSYRFYMLVSIAAAVLELPLMLLSPQFTPLVMLGALGTAEFINLFNIPTCLFSSRLELFSESFFSLQGANTKINFYSLLMLVPATALFSLWFFFGSTVWAFTAIGLGLVSAAVSKVVTARVAAAFWRRRYERMETFMK